MYSNGNPRIVEGTDIEQVQSLGDAVTLADGRTALPVLLVLAAHSGKTYGPGQLPDSLHYTDGVLPRLLPLLPEGALTRVAVAEEAPAISGPGASGEPQEQPTTKSAKAAETPKADVPDSAASETQAEGTETNQGNA